jgi:hypothetical protein
MMYFVSRELRGPDSLQDYLDSFSADAKILHIVAVCDASSVTWYTVVTDSPLAPAPEPGYEPEQDPFHND